MFLDTQSAVEADVTEADSTALSHRERDDAYRFVALTLTDKWRVIPADDGSQWILQQRRTKDRWTSRKFFARAAHLAHRVKELVPEAFPAAKAWADRLPNV